MSPSAYSLVNPDLASYAADAFVYSHLSDLNYRSVTDPSSSSPSSSNNHHSARMSPYARQSFYPMYTQRDIHSPSRPAADYVWSAKENSTGGKTDLLIYSSFQLVCVHFSFF